MIDWLTIVIALVIIATLVGFFGFLAWKINMSDPLVNDDSNQHSDVTSEKKKKEKAQIKRNPNVTPKTKNKYERKRKEQQYKPVKKPMMNGKKVNKN